VDAYDYPTAQADLNAYRSQYSLPACGSGCFTKVNQNGAASPLPPAAGSSGWDVEEALDIDMVSAICPNCKILVEAKSASFANLGAAVNEAAALGANAISNSYGGSDASDSSYGKYYNHAGIAGVNWNAKIMPVRVLDSRGEGFDSTIAAGITYATDHGADVINLSLGGSLPLIGGSSASFDAAVDRALDRGIVVVAAAGNDGLPVCEQSAGQGRLLCVGAVDKRGNRSYFSNFGGGLAITAPGGSGLPGADEDILSTWNDGGYRLE